MSCCGCCPANDRPHDRAEGLDVLYVRCIVREAGGEYVYVSAEKGLPGQLLAVDISADDLAYLRKMAHEGVQLNLLDCKMGDAPAGSEPARKGAEHVIVPGLVVFEPDYLIDISSIAACFKDYGHHPLTYTLERMRPRANSSAITAWQPRGGCTRRHRQRRDGVQPQRNDALKLRREGFGILRMQGFQG